MSKKMSGSVKERRAMQALCQRIYTSDKVRTLHMDETCLETIRYNLPLFFECLRDDSNSLIEKVVINASSLFLVFPGDEVNEIVEQLGHLRGVKHLEILLKYPRGTKGLSGSSLAHFLHLATKLETLTIQCLLFIRDTCLEELKEVLENPTSLERIEITNIMATTRKHGYPSISDQVHNKPLCLCSLLQSLTTIPKLKHLQLASGSCWPHQKETGIFSDPLCATYFSQLLQHNSNLETLQIRNAGLANVHAKAIAQALSSARTSLQKLDLRFNPGMDARGQLLLIDALIIESCCLISMDLDWHVHQPATVALARMALHLRLNRAGRHLFLKQSGITHRERVEILIGCKEQVDMTFVLLQQNPSVFLSCCQD